MQGNYSYYPPADYYAQKARELTAGMYPPNQFQLQNQSQNQFQPQAITLFVTSVEEARSYRIDNPMNTYIFIDSYNGKIYTKKIGNDGAAVLEAYAKENPPTPITSDEKIAMLEKRLAEIESRGVRRGKESQGVSE